MLHFDARSQRGIHLQAMMQILLALGLGLLQGSLRVLYELVRVTAVVRIERETTSCRHCNITPVNRERLLEQPHDITMQLAQVTFGGASQRNHHDKGSASQVSEALGIRAMRLETLGNTLQQA